MLDMWAVGWFAADHSSVWLPTSNQLQAGAVSWHVCRYTSVSLAVMHWPLLHTV